MSQKQNLNKKAASQVPPTPPNSEDESKENDYEESTEKVTKTRSPVTVDDVLKDLQEIRELLTGEIVALQSLHSRVKGVRKLQGIRKKVENVEKRIPKLTKRKRTVKANNNSGFGKLMTPSKELSTFLKLEKGQKISRTDVTRAICAYIHIDENEKRDEILVWESKMNPNRKRNLQNANDKNRIDPDEKLLKLLKYDKYKISVANGEIKTKRKQPNGTRKEITLEDDNLYYTTIQRLLTHHLKNI